MFNEHLDFYWFLILSKNVFENVIRGILLYFGGLILLNYHHHHGIIIIMKHLTVLGKKLSFKMILFFRTQYCFFERYILYFIQFTYLFYDIISFSLWSLRARDCLGISDNAVILIKILRKSDGKSGHLSHNRSGQVTNISLTMLWWKVVSV